MTIDEYRRCPGVFLVNFRHELKSRALRGAVRLMIADCHILSRKVLQTFVRIRKIRHSTKSNYLWHLVVLVT